MPSEFEPLNRFAQACGASRTVRTELFRLWVLADTDRRWVRTQGTGGLTELAPAAHPAGVPAQLPATVSGFTGRTAELSELNSLAARGAIVAVTGAPGSGKTALVVQWAHQIRERFSDGQLYADLRGYAPGRPVPAREVLAGFLDALGVAAAHIPAGIDQRAARYRTELSRRRMLVVLDNVAAVHDVRPLLPGPPCLTVATSRDTLAGLVARDGAKRLQLDCLPRGEAADLLRALVGERVDADPVAAADLAVQCGGLPLALRVVAEFTLAPPGMDLRTIVDELAAPARRLDLLSAGEDQRTGLGDVFSWSYRRLSAPDARAFRLLGEHSGPGVTPGEAATLIGCTPTHARSWTGWRARHSCAAPARIDTQYPNRCGPTPAAVRASLVSTRVTTLRTSGSSSAATISAISVVLRLVEPGRLGIRCLVVRAAVNRRRLCHLASHDTFPNPGVAGVGSPPWGYPPASGVGLRAYGCCWCPVRVVRGRLSVRVWWSNR